MYNYPTYVTNGEPYQSKTCCPFDQMTGSAEKKEYVPVDLSKRRIIAIHPATTCTPYTIEYDDGTLVSIRF